ncbi:MAG: class I tRNA ligase family protein, partial [Candidatus Omnitrophica bacterium]|nr:class I tRNA ligase family protein [Candidatus Omnitrophota bacterium]
MIKFYNTLTKKKEEFIPIEDKIVRLYTCGPTVYDLAHIGNFRAYIFEDLLHRYLEYRGYKVIRVMNITDVDDKTIKGAKNEGISLREFTDRYIKIFLEDMEILRLKKPDYMPRATEHIKEMVELIKKLLEKGYAYYKDNSIYFSISKFPSYGKLSGIDLSKIKVGARVDADEYEKQDVRDFVLWKAAKEEEGVWWETEIGKGRPGWHIECSAMSMKYLGETFDI